MTISKQAQKHPLIDKAVEYCKSVNATEISYITILDSTEFRVMFTNADGKGEAKILTIG